MKKNKKKRRLLSLNYLMKLQQKLNDKNDIFLNETKKLENMMMIFFGTEEYKNYRQKFIYYKKKYINNQRKIIFNKKSINLLKKQKE